MQYEGMLQLVAKSFFFTKIWIDWMQLKHIIKGIHIL